MRLRIEILSLITCNFGFAFILFSLYFGDIIPHPIIEILEVVRGLFIFEIEGRGLLPALMIFSLLTCLLFILNLASGRLTKWWLRLIGASTAFLGTMFFTSLM